LIIIVWYRNKFDRVYLREWIFLFEVTIALKGLKTNIPEIQNNTVNSWVLMKRI